MQEIVPALRISRLLCQLGVYVPNGSLIPGPLLDRQRIASQQVKEATGRFHGIQFAGVIVLDGPAGFNIAVVERLCISRIAHHQESIQHQAVEVAPAVRFSLGVPGKTTLGIVIHRVFLLHIPGICPDQLRVMLRDLRIAAVGCQSCRRQAADHHTKRQYQRADPRPRFFCTHISSPPFRLQIVALSIISRAERQGPLASQQTHAHWLIIIPLPRLKP